MIELTLWYAVFRGLAIATGTTQLGGFGREWYLAYAIWAPFVSRITSNWMYEGRMIEEIESGSINGILTRPMSFFEYYLSQFLGYKITTTLLSLMVPIAAIAILDLPTQWERLPGALALIGLYLIFLHLLSFAISTLAFSLTRVFSFTVAKNLAMVLLSGELLPLDLFPETWRNILLWLPFANAVYVPVGYLTGRIGPDIFLQGLFTLTVGILVASVLAWRMWRSGLSRYVGTGA